MQNYKLQRRQTWFKILPSFKPQQLQSVQDKLDNLQNDQEKMRLEAAIKEIKEGCQNDDEELKIDLGFLMEEEEGNTKRSLI